MGRDTRKGVSTSRYLVPDHRLNNTQARYSLSTSKDVFLDEGLTQDDVAEDATHQNKELVATWIPYLTEDDVHHVAIEGEHGWRIRAQFLGGWLFHLYAKWLVPLVPISSVEGAMSLVLCRSICDP